MPGWDYEGNATNDNGETKCPGCPGTDSIGVDCPLGTQQQRFCRTQVRAGNVRVLAMVQAYFDQHGNSKRSVSPFALSANAAAIESCDFRRSDCACLGKPATCLQAGLPATVVCLTNGPDGGPCAGT